MQTEGISGLEYQQRRLQRRRRRERIAAAIIATVVVGYSVYLYFKVKQGFDGVSLPVKTMSALSGMTTLTFPTGSVLKSGVYRKAWRFTVTARVEMPRASVLPFLHRNSLDVDKNSNGSGGRKVKGELSSADYLPDRLPGWDVASARNFYVAQWQPTRWPKGYLAGNGSMLIDLDRPGVADVYVCLMGD